MARLLLMAGAACATGCASPHGVPSRGLNPASELARGMMRSVSIRHAGPEDARRVDEPWRKSNAAGRGALAGAGGMMVAGLQGAPETCGLSIVLGVFLTPVGAIIGAGVGHAESLEDEEVESGVRCIVAGLQMVEPARDIAERVDGLVRSQTRLGSSVAPGTWTPGARAAEGAGVLELTVESFGLRAASGGPQPQLTAYILARGRLREGAGGGVLHELEWDREGETRSFQEWVQAGNGAIQAEFTRLEHDIADVAVDEMFRLVVVP